MGFEDGLTLAGTSHTSHETDSVPGDVFEGGCPHLKGNVVGGNQMYGLDWSILRRSIGVCEENREPTASCIFRDLMFLSIIPCVRANADLFEIVDIEPLGRVLRVPVNLGRVEVYAKLHLLPLLLGNFCEGGSMLQSGIDLWCNASSFHSTGSRGLAHAREISSFGSTPGSKRFFDLFDFFSVCCV